MTDEERALLEHVLVGVRHARRLLANEAVDLSDNAREVLALAQGRLEGLLGVDPDDRIESTP